MNKINVLERVLETYLWHPAYPLRWRFSVFYPAMKLGAEELDILKIQAILPKNLR